MYHLRSRVGRRPHTAKGRFQLDSNTETPDPVMMLATPLGAGLDVACIDDLGALAPLRSAKRQTVVVDESVWKLHARTIKSWQLAGRLVVSNGASFSASDDSNLLVAIGGGSLIDSVKQTAACIGAEWIAIPSRITQAAFSTTASAKTPAGIATLSCPPPLAVLVSHELILSLPTTHILYDAIDAMSFLSAIPDVFIATEAGEHAIDPSAVRLARVGVLEARRLSFHDVHAVIIPMFKLLKLLAPLSAWDGSTRYVSGSEHLIAHALTKEGVSGSHGRLVAVGMNHAFRLQSLFPELAKRNRIAGTGCNGGQLLRELIVACGLDLRASALNISPIAFARVMASAPFVRIIPRRTILDRFSAAELRDYSNDFFYTA